MQGPARSYFLNAIPLIGATAFRCPKCHTDPLESERLGVPEAAERKLRSGEQSAAHKEPSSLRNARTGPENQAIAGSSCVALPAVDDPEARASKIPSPAISVTPQRPPSSGARSQRSLDERPKGTRSQAEGHASASPFLGPDRHLYALETVAPPSLVPRPAAALSPGGP